MLHFGSWRRGSLSRLGARVGAALVCAALLAACADADGSCPTQDCPWCTCDAQLVEGFVDGLTDDAAPSCGSLAPSACQRSAQCTLVASCAAPSICRGNNCNDACDVVTSCVPFR